MAGLKAVLPDLGMAALVCWAATRLPFILRPYFVLVILHYTVCLWVFLRVGPLVIREWESPLREQLALTGCDPADALRQRIRPIVARSAVLPVILLVYLAAISLWSEHSWFPWRAIKGFAGVLDMYSHEGRGRDTLYLANILLLVPPLGLGYLMAIIASFDMMARLCALPSDEANPRTLMVTWLLILLAGSLLVALLGMTFLLTPLLYFTFWKIAQKKWRWACEEYFGFWD